MKAQNLIHCRVSPWMGGFYERVVKAVKRTLAIEQRLTFLCEADEIENSRPLFYVQDRWHSASHNFDTSSFSHLIQI